MSTEIKRGNSPLHRRQAGPRRPIVYYLLLKVINIVVNDIQVEKESISGSLYHIYPMESITGNAGERGETRGMPNRDRLSRKGKFPYWVSNWNSRHDLASGTAT